MGRVHAQRSDQAEIQQLQKYYDPEIFCAAGKRIRAMARAADKLSIEERIERITDIFSTFRNPDKETVLTPWRVVNMHLGDCLGGYNFYDAEYQNVISEPRFIDKGEVTAEVFSLNPVFWKSIPNPDFIRSIWHTVFTGQGQRLLFSL